jgi:hypothetical protein
VFFSDASFILTPIFNRIEIGLQPTVNILMLSSQLSFEAAFYASLVFINCEDIGNFVFVVNFVLKLSAERRVNHVILCLDIFCV